MLNAKMPHINLSAGKSAKRVPMEVLMQLEREARTFAVGLNAVRSAKRVQLMQPSERSEHTFVVDLGFYAVSTRPACRATASFICCSVVAGAVHVLRSNTSIPRRGKFHHSIPNRYQPYKTRNKNHITKQRFDFCNYVTQVGESSVFQLEKEFSASLRAVRNSLNLLKGKDHPNGELRRMSFTAQGPDIVVANGATLSNEITADSNYEGAYGIMIHAPAVLAEAGTFLVAVKGAGTFSTLQNDTPADETIPTAGKARLYIRLPFAGSFKISLGGAAGAIRTFKTSIVSD